MQPLYQPPHCCTGVAVTENLHCTNGEAYFGVSERYHPQTRMTKQNPEVTIQMMEVYNELIRDLLRVPDRGSAGLLDITESAEKGVHAKVCVCVCVCACV